MLRPERMSRVSVTGARRVMDDVIEAIHDLQLLHVTEYDGSWDGFEPGDPVEGADEASQKLVTVRALKTTLGVTGEDVGPTTQIVTDEALDEELESVRRDVNELDDRRDELRDELRSVEERIDTMEPFVSLGIDLDLLGGYDSLSVRVGEGDPGEYLEQLRHRKQQLDSKLSTVEDELEDLKLEVGGFLLAAEEELTIEVQKREAPLTFATTENAFVAEGWIPTDEVGEMEAALSDAVGDHVEFSELERADYDEDGHAVAREEVHGGDEESPPAGQPTAANGAGEGVAATEDEGGSDERARADGGTVTMGSGDPPVVQNNPGPVKPFEPLVEIINRPKYTELDPTVVFFLTFPAFFGFMIGDLGYGILYVLMGLALVRRFDSDVVKSLGGVAMWAGGFTTLFGILYGEFFGLHQLGEIVWGGDPPMHKGLQPAYSDYALTWLVVSLLAGLVHLTVGYLFGFVQELNHGARPAILEKGSWIMMLGGIWVFVFSTFAESVKPGFLFTLFAEGGVYPLGFSGFSPTVGLAGLGVFFVGLVLLALGDLIEVIEFLNVLVNVLSYTRIAAVLLAKAGMAFVVNLLFFGVYVDSHGGWHFGISGMPTIPEGQQAVAYHGYEVTEIMFGGLLHSGIAGVLVGILILVVGHLLVLVLGITSAGLQGVRLEYVEFFGKFYEGGGKPYSPFGHDREYTSE